MPSLAALVTAVAPAGSEAYSPGRTASSWKFEAQSVVKNLIGCGPIVKEGTHPLLTRKSIELYEKITGKKFTTAEKNLMAKGAIQEDSPEFCYARSMNHFTEMGTHQGIWGFPSSQEWAQSTKAQSGMMPVDNLPFGIKQFYQWMVSKLQGMYPEGNHSWERAVKEKNFESLGHVLHLVQDLTAPAHVRNDKHPGPVGLNFEEANIHTYIHGDSYEGWAEDNSKLALLNPTKIPSYTSLDEIFNDVVQFTGENFYSDNSIGAYAKPAFNDLKEKKGMLLVYYYNTINGKEVPIARKSFLTTILNEVGKKNVQNYVLDGKVLEEQWKILGTRAVEMGAAVIALYVKETSGVQCGPHAAKMCSGNDVYWKDSCGKLEDKVQSCGTNQTCVDATCVDTKPTCTPQYSKTCSNGDVYWQDSCGNLENVAQSCTSNQTCSNGQCVDDKPSCTPSSGCPDTGCLFYDDFGTDLCKWIVSTKNIILKNGILDMYAPYYEVLGSMGVKLNCTSNFSLEFKVKSESANIDLSLGYDGLKMDKFGSVSCNNSFIGNKKGNIDFSKWNTIRIELESGVLKLYQNNNFVNEVSAQNCKISNEFINISCWPETNSGNCYIDYIKATCN